MPSSSGRATPVDLPSVLRRRPRAQPCTRRPRDRPQTCARRVCQRSSRAISVANPVRLALLDACHVTEDPHRSARNTTSKPSREPQWRHAANSGAFGRMRGASQGHLTASCQRPTRARSEKPSASRLDRRVRSQRRAEHRSRRSGLERHALLLHVEVVREQRPAQVADVRPPAPEQRVPAAPGHDHPPEVRFEARLPGPDRAAGRRGARAWEAPQATAKKARGGRNEATRPPRVARRSARPRRRSRRSAPPGRE